MASVGIFNLWLALRLRLARPHWCFFRVTAGLLVTILAGLVRLFPHWLCLFDTRLRLLG